MYEKPTVRVLGSLGRLTQQIPKQVGPDDNLVFITNSSITIGS